MYQLIPEAAFPALLISILGDVNVPVKVPPVNGKFNEARPVNVAVIVFVLGTYFNPVSVFNAWLPLALLANKIYLDVVPVFSAEVETADAVAAFPVVL